MLLTHHLKHYPKSISAFLDGHDGAASAVPTQVPTIGPGNLLIPTGEF